MFQVDHSFTLYYNPNILGSGRLHHVLIKEGLMQKLSGLDLYNQSKIVHLNDLCVLNRLYVNNTSIVVITPSQAVY